MADSEFIVKRSDLVLVTGSNGFIGSRVVSTLARYGFTNIRCMVRPSSNLETLEAIRTSCDNLSLDIVKGNLLSRADCERVADGARVLYHLAAGRGEKSYPDAYMNSVVTTRNMCEVVASNAEFKRFVNVSSFSVYSNQEIRPGGLLDETCAIEPQPHKTGEAYCYAKVRQEEMVVQYGKTRGLPYVIVRPGVVYGPGNKGLTGRVGIGTFGIFLHLGGSNLIPLTFVDNCAEAIVLAGLVKGVEGEVFNIVDDDLPTSRQFLRMYKKNVGRFKSIYLPHVVSYALSYLWEKYCDLSGDQLPRTFNRRKWSNYWKGNRYSNAKIKEMLGWFPRVNKSDATLRYCEYQIKARSAQ